MNYLLKKVLIMLSLTLNGWISAGAQDVYNWRNAFGEVWKSSSGECWRSLAWTAGTAAPMCDGALAPKPVVVVPVEQVTPKAVPPDIEKPVVVEPPPVPIVLPPPVMPTPEKLSYKTVTLFDFDKAVISPEARLQLNEVVLKAKNMNLEVVIVIGHADATGPESYNLDLSLRRAAAVKSYLVSKGLDKNRIFTEGKGESQPIVDNRTRQNRAKNRRVEVEVLGKSM